MKKVNSKEDWMNSKWRPAMGWMYMIVCIFDFIIFPIGFTIVQFWETEASNDAFRQWNPLTLSGAGLFHMAMGAVLGITAWSRGQEKIQGVAGQSISNQSNVPSMPAQQSYNNYTPNYNTPSSYPSSYENNNLTIVPVASGYKGKKAPVQPDDPVL